VSVSAARLDLPTVTEANTDPRHAKEAQSRGETAKEGRRKSSLHAVTMTTVLHHHVVMMTGALGEEAIDHPQDAAPLLDACLQEEIALHVAEKAVVCGAVQALEAETSVVMNAEMTVETTVELVALPSANVVPIVMIVEAVVLVIVVAQMIAVEAVGLVIVEEETIVVEVGAMNVAVDMVAADVVMRNVTKVALIREEAGDNLFTGTTFLRTVISTPAQI